MNFSTLIGESLVSLGKNKVRTALSMLGIIIGVGAVITLVAMAHATEMRIQAEIEKMGDDWVWVSFWGIPTGGARRNDAERKPMQTKEDADAIMEQCPAVRAASPVNRMAMQVKSSYNNYQTAVRGVYPCYLDIRRWEIEYGTAFTEADDAALRPVCLIGQTPAKELFGSIDPVGEEITVNNCRFKIIGLLASKGRVGDRDRDDEILFPYMTFQRKIAGQERSASLVVAAQRNLPPQIAEEQVIRLLRERHNAREGDPNPFRTHAVVERAEEKAATSQSFEWLLRMIAGVSLLVGGIGIMNIMLVSVTERTREIGLRMAIGASGGDVLMQFLVEAVVLCTMGGIIGMFAGWGFSFALTAWKGYETQVSYWIAAIALGFATITGVFFGFYPAWRASRLDPIEALRYE